MVSASLSERFPRATSFAAGELEHRVEPQARLLSWLRLMTFTRVIIVGVLLGSTALVEQSDVTVVSTVGSSPDATPFFLLVTGSAVLALSMLYALLLRWFKASADKLRRLAYVQLAGDAVFAASLVLITGGTSSSFTFFFSVTILLSAVVLLRPGALFQATSCSLLFVTIGVLEASGVSLIDIHLPSGSPGLLTGLDRSDRAGMLGGLVYKVINNVLAFYALGFLASHLAESVRQREVRLSETEQSLEELRALHDNIIASIPSGVLTTDKERKVTYFNPRAEAITGITAEQAQGKKVGELFPVLNRFAGERRDQETVTLSSTIGQPDGARRHLQWQVSELSSPDGETLGQLVTCQDVTQLRDMEEKVRVGQRFASIGRLAASIAHEIRNPLTSISGSIQLLRQTLNVDGANARLMNIVSNETDALNSWITDFLMYARPRLSDPVPMNLRALVEDAVTTIENNRSNESLTFAVRGADVVMTQADPTYLRQAVWNLLTNAVQASPEGGTVECILEPLSDDMVRLSICDEGPGIEQSLRDRIFDPFVTTKDHGTGLGLATAYRVVNEHGGRLTYDTRLGRGTTFLMDLPAAAHSDNNEGSETAVPPTI